MHSLKTFVFGVLGGVSISLGGAAFLSSESKTVGALFFVVGLFTICTFGFNLFTGKVCYLFENDARYAVNLLWIWLGNFVGTWLAAAALRCTRMTSAIAKAEELCSGKLNDSLVSVFILAVFCNILIYIAVDGYKNNPHEAGKYLALIFGVSVFVVCGFEHCVANMFYISLANMWSAKALAFILVNTLGNAVGGVLVPILKKPFRQSV